MKHEEKVRSKETQITETDDDGQSVASGPFIFQVCDLSSVAIAGSRAPPVCPPLSRKENWWSLSAKNIAL